MGEDRIAFKILKGKLTGKTPVGRLGCRWEDSIRIDLDSWEHIFISLI